MADSSPLHKASTGTKALREWYWYGGVLDSPRRVRRDDWHRYPPEAEFHLTASWLAMLAEERSRGIVLDLAPFTGMTVNYQVWRGHPVEVANRHADDKAGQAAIAGLSQEFWDLSPHQVPNSARMGRVVGKFYQVAPDQVTPLEVLQRWLEDPCSPPNPLGGTEVKRRLVILVEIDRPDKMFGDPDRFRKRKSVPVQASAAEVLEESDAVPPGEAIFQWWWGDVNPGGIGRWKSYHPLVSQRLEQELATNAAFRTCRSAVHIDPVRYMLQRISRDNPFDYSDAQQNGEVFRELWVSESRITVEDSHFDAETRATNNCFVQFQKGNPKRRRPVRRVRRGEVAGLDVKTGDPCSICFSDDGSLIGCKGQHVICRSCRWAALRAVVGDVTQTKTLVCGCLSYEEDQYALRGLADVADKDLQALVAEPPHDQGELQEFEMELAQVRRQFQVADVPAGIFKQKVDGWIELVRKHALEHLYHACATPGCRMDNWILRTDFDEQYRSKGQVNWVCKAGHRNSVLPSNEEINDINRNILSRPQHYTDRCGHDSMPLRRFRLCPECAAEGLLTFAVHEDGCKQWPGGGAGHRHCFCWHCTRKWGAECNHGVMCSDPGIQQVRRADDGAGGQKLELGYVNGEAYIQWIRTGRNCPPTVFPSSQTTGAARQSLLNLEDKEELKRWLEER
eukprot:TRINITY_DN66807_c0_g1_i1.p1 TRINITY_DN66807_c0_g1~~TRINITY_DN66807_c0_g1_i1.p1  ORF type:complete len:690 (-),score=124.64 TRINITY_DN66807_c0_g1_i1:28-2061(-)